MTRCELCHRIIWPWQHRGWVVYDGVRHVFHAKCHEGVLG